MPLHRPKTNPAHPNYGRQANFNQRLTRRLSFVNFSCKGVSGNLKAAVDQLMSSIKEPEFSQLPPLEQQAIIGLRNSLMNAASMLTDLSEDAGEINRDKTNIELGQKKSRKERARA